MIHGVDDLEEGGLDPRRVAGVCGVSVDQVVEASSGAIIEKGGSVLAKLDVLVQRDDVGMMGEEVVDSALIFPVRRFQGDFQRQLTCVVSVGDAEDSAKGTMGDVLLDVKLIADLSIQQLRFEYVDVRGDRHCSCQRRCRGYVWRRRWRCEPRWVCGRSQGGR